MVDAVFLAEDEALPLAGLGQQVAPGDVLVLIALEAVIADVACDLIVEALDQGRRPTPRPRAARDSSWPR